MATVEIYSIQNREDDKTYIKMLNLIKNNY